MKRKQKFIVYKTSLNYLYYCRDCIEEMKRFKPIPDAKLDVLNEKSTNGGMARSYFYTIELNMDELLDLANQMKIIISFDILLEYPLIEIYDTYRE